MRKKYVIGVDTGGTFTDVVAEDIETAFVTIAKAPTTPFDLSVGVMDAIEEAAKSMNMTRRELLARASALKHGTTAGTNAIINQTGAKVGLVVTKGFEDTTLIGRAVQRVDGLSEEEVRKMLLITKPKPLVQRPCIKGVYERVDYRGNVVVPLNTEDAREQIRSLVEDEKVEAIAVCLLFSFVNPIHEREIGSIISQLYPGHELFVTLSHELVRLLREYGRANTVILNCFIGKLMQRYLSDLEQKLRGDGFEGRFLVMQANGGLLSWNKVPPVRTISSGPTGGVIGSKYTADLMGDTNVVSTDMGGTSLDVSLIRNGRWDYEREPVISRWRVMLPMVKVTSIGAGGGTIARADRMLHRLLVGPDSAGAVPGPACYGAGGTEATVCDADLVLGLLNPDYFLGGRIKLDKSKAEQAIRENIGIPLGMDVIEAASGIFTIVGSQMADSIRVYTMGAGLSADEYCIYAFGGMGPVHVAHYGHELGVGRAYCHPTSAVFSAFGIAGSDIIRTLSISLSYRMPIDAATLNAALRELEDELTRDMADEGFSRDGLEFRHTFSMRWARQVLHHSISVPAREYTTAEDIDSLLERWVADFERIYGKGVAYTRAGIELVAVDIDAIAKVIKPVYPCFKEGGANPCAALKGFRKALFPTFTKDFVEATIYDYGKLQPNNVIEGPSIVESPTTTVVVPPNVVARVDRFKSIVLEL